MREAINCRSSINPDPLFIEGGFFIDRFMGNIISTWSALNMLKVTRAHFCHGPKWPDYLAMFLNLRRILQFPFLALAKKFQAHGCL